MLLCPELIAVKKTDQGSLLVILARLLKFLEGNFFTKSAPAHIRMD